MLALAALPRIAYSQPSIPVGFDDALVANVASPTALASTPDGRLLIASQLGRVYVYVGGHLLDNPALDLSATVCDYRERGLDGVTVDPDFITNHFIYVTYSFNKFGDCDAEIPAATPVARVSRFVLADDNTVSLDTERVLIDNLPSTIGVHGLDDVGFGKDGYLYLSVGDGGCDYAGDSGCFAENNAARDMHALVGKILRITRDGDIPPDNPFSGEGTVRCSSSGGTTPGNICQEIFATGLRNPWRITFDPNATGTRFFINDVGQDTWEEINEGAAGADYGWNIREGNCADDSTTDCSPIAPAGLTNPIFSYGHADGCSSITGGAFVPIGAWPAEFDGIYLFSDYVCGTIFKLLPDGVGGYTRESFVTNLGNSSATDLYFGPSDGGIALYYTTYANGGEVRQIVYTGSTNRRPAAAIQATPLFGPTPLDVTFDGTGSTDPDGDALVFDWDFGDGTSTQGASTAQHSYAAPGSYVATLKVADPAGASSSASVRIDAGNTPPKPVITSPAADFHFAVGDVITLQGHASDPEDGELPTASLTWRVLLHHNTHTHGFIPPTSGDTLTFRAPGPENLEAAATSYLDLELTATDSAGLQATVVQPLMPRTSAITFLSNPAGAQLLVDNGLVTTPVTFNSWVNFSVSVQAASQPTPEGGQLVFTSWSDGGAAAHSIVTPSSDSSYTASFTTTGLPTSTPFGGTSTALPGLIQVEDFDDGGEGIAYHDGSPGNYGGMYRQTDVDVETTTDANGGFDLGWAMAGEWLNYTVNVSTSGSYDVAVRVASNGQGGTFHIEANGTNITGPLNISNSGGWQNWTTITAPRIFLSAGPQVWRVVLDANGPTGAVGNFNWVRVTAPAPANQSTPFGGSAVALPGTIQAENFDDGGELVAYHDASTGNDGGGYRQTDVDIEPSADATGGFDVGWAFAGEWLKYTVNVAAAGTYDLDVRVASDGDGGTFHIEVNGTSVTGPLSVPNTGGWQTWTTIHASGLALNAGAQVWRVVMDTNGASGAVGNFNWIQVTPGAPQ